MTIFSTLKILTEFIPMTAYVSEVNYEENYCGLTNVSMLNVIEGETTEIRESKTWCYTKKV